MATTSIGETAVRRKRLDRDRTWTPDEVRALIRPDRPSPRYELIDGRLLVTPSPFAPHQRMLGELFVRIKPYVDEHQLGEAFVSPADIALDSTSVLQPDLFVVPPEHLPDEQWDFVKHLTLAVEVPSRGSRRTDRGIKREFYQRHRVDEYWIVDLGSRLVERWRPDDARPEVLHDWLAWAPRDGVTPLSLDLRALFGRVATVGHAARDRRPR